MFHSSQNRITNCGSLSFEWGNRTYIMGILNMTPDSFSGDGLDYDIDSALEQAIKFQQDGADIIDVGGESTRPGATRIDVSEEKRRVIPVIKRLASELSIPISVDTYKFEVAKDALDVGASMVNDVWGLKYDDKMPELVADAKVPVIIMHNQDGSQYLDLIPDIVEGLNCSIERAITAGVDPKNLILDPGIGFGKTANHNLEIIRRLTEIKAIGFPLMMGTSRKSTLGLVLDLPIEDRIEGTAASVALSIANGADIVRVHDVKEMYRVCRMSDAVVRGWDNSLRD